MKTTYYRVACTREHEMSGAGLGYEEIYGDGPRFFWDRADALVRCDVLNCTNSEDLTGCYSVEVGRVYADGSWDDDGNTHARAQLGMGADAVTAYRCLGCGLVVDMAEGDELPRGDERCSHEFEPLAEGTRP